MGRYLSLIHIGVSYPIYHIENIVKPVSKGPHAKQVIFLSADAFGVLPVSYTHLDVYKRQVKRVSFNKALQINQKRFC